MRRWAVAWGPAATWAAVLFFLSSRPSVGVPLPNGLDKLAHLVAYLVLGLLLARAVSRLGLPPLSAIAIGWVYGFLDELHQSFVPGRHAEVGDWIADALGVVLGVAIYFSTPRLRDGHPGSARAETTTT